MNSTSPKHWLLTSPESDFSTSTNLDVSVSVGLVLWSSSPQLCPLSLLPQTLTNLILLISISLISPTFVLFTSTPSSRPLLLLQSPSLSLATKIYPVLKSKASSHLIFIQLLILYHYQFAAKNFSGTHSFLSSLQMFYFRFHYCSSILYCQSVLTGLCISTWNNLLPPILLPQSPLYVSHSMLYNTNHFHHLANSYSFLTLIQRLIPLADLLWYPFPKSKPYASPWSSSNVLCRVLIQHFTGHCYIVCLDTFLY